MIEPVAIVQDQFESINGATALLLNTPQADLQPGDVLVATVWFIAPPGAPPAAWQAPNHPPLPWPEWTLHAQQIDGQSTMMVASRVWHGYEQWGVNLFEVAGSYGDGHTTFMAGALLAFRGVDALDPLDAAPAFSPETAGNSFTAPSVTSESDGAMLVAVWAMHGKPNLSLPAGITQQVNLTGAPRMEGGVKQLGAAGATGDQIATATGQPKTGMGVALALRPE